MKRRMFLGCMSPATHRVWVLMHFLEVTTGETEKIEPPTNVVNASVPAFGTACIVAASEGAQAAFDINKELLKEDLA